MFRTLTSPQLAFDVSIAVVCVLLRIAVGVEPRMLLLAVVLFGGGLAIRRLSPAFALGTVWIGAVLQMVSGATPDAANLAILAVLYATARYGEPAVRWFGLASAGLGAVIAGLYLYFWRALLTPELLERMLSPGWVVGFAGVLIGIFAVLGLSWTLGMLVRTWATALETRRSQTRAEGAVAVEQERNRIARDMHDVVAHSLAVVVAQADGARYTEDAAAKDAALATIAGTAREALSDVRLLLGQLRHQQEAGPQPVLGDLDQLVAQLRSSGLEISITRGDLPPLPTGAQLAIYRIAQEALTNALRHGDRGQPVQLRLSALEGAVELIIDSALAGQTSLVEGHGLAGMRERAILAGGNLTAGPVGSRWIVRASIPIAKDPA